MRIIDLTHKFTADMPVYPGDAKPEMVQVSNLKEHGWVDFRLSTVMHVGTHIDAPLHFIENGKKITDFAIEKFVGRGVLVDARGKDIGRNLLKESVIQKGDIVLILTGHDKKFRDSDYYTSFPSVGEDFADELVKRGVSIVGLDTPTPDAPPFPVHKILLASEVLIIENLTGLEHLVGIKNFEIVALPANFDIEAAPVRVMAKVA